MEIVFIAMLAIGILTILVLSFYVARIAQQPKDSPVLTRVTQRRELMQRLVAISLNEADANHILEEQANLLGLPRLDPRAIASAIERAKQEKKLRRQKGAALRALVPNEFEASRLILLEAQHLGVSQNSLAALDRALEEAKSVHLQHVDKAPGEEESTPQIPRQSSSN